MSLSSISFMSFFSVLFVAVVLSFRASERSKSRIFALSRLISSTRKASSSITAFRYSAGSSIACSIGISRFPGQPPRTIYSARFLSSTSPVIAGFIFPSHNSSSETLPLELPDSKSDIGRILSLAILPAPLCNIPFLFGVDEPVKIKFPLLPRSSTLLLTASQSGGHSCHSSIILGVSPSKTSSGESSANCLF